MSKISVETTGNFMLLDPTSGDIIEAYGHSNVEQTSWIENQILIGRLKAEKKIDKEDVANPGSDVTPVKAPVHKAK
jgi:hypothetical protein